MDKKEVTIGEFVDAIEQDGFRQARGAWIRFSEVDGAVLNACAMGQACINLEVKHTDIVGSVFGPDSHGVFYDIKDDKGKWNLTGRIMHLNDSSRLSCKEIADKIREEFSHSLHKKVKFNTKKYTIRNKV